jgi:hypothetical protein
LAVGIVFELDWLAQVLQKQEAQTGRTSGLTLDGWLSSNGSTGPVAGLFSGGTPPFHLVESNGNIAAFEVDGITRGPAVPEPSTWAMMLVGFVGLGYAGFRRARGALRLAA